MAGSAILSPATSQPPRSFLRNALLLVIAITLADFLFHWYFNNRYGYFRDEFDYMSCGDHLAWGYVDQPPLIPFLVRFCRFVFGDSVRSIRLLPAIASSLLLIQTAILAKEFGGRLFALLLSATAVLIAPQYLSNGSLLTTNCLEPNLWMGCAYFAIRAIHGNQPRNWLWFGIIAGIGLEEKYSIALFAFGIVVGLLLTEHRRVFLDKWIWIGGAAALVIFLPNLLWNFHHDWPFLQLMHNIRVDRRDVVLPPVEYFLQQVLLMHPLSGPIWIAGLIALFVSPRPENYRCLGWSYVVCYAVMFFEHGKNYYLTPIYPMLLAAGAVMIELALDRPGWSWARAALVIALLAGGAWLVPIVVPVFSPDHFVAYMGRLPFKLPVMEHAHERAVLPQWYADQFGWQEIVAATANAYNRVPANERSQCGIFAQDYGQAGAIDFLGRRYGLPPALSGHQTWFLWGPRRYSGNCMIVLDDRKDVLQRYWSTVEYVGRSVDNPYALERQIPVFICRGSKFGTLTGIWPMVKKWR